jgi:hypothetical protein
MKRQMPKKTDSLRERVAHRLCTTPDKLNGRLYRQAVSAVKRKTDDLYDAFANAAQLVGNLRNASAVAVVYAYLAEG